MTTFTGKCLCGGVRFSVAEPLEPIQICHCLQCRQAQGGPFASNLPVRREQFEMQAGDDLLQIYESSPGKERVFCRRCGSPIFSRRTSLPGVMRIRAGLFEQPLPSRPKHHAYVSDKANWWEINDGLPQFSGPAS